MLPVLAFEAMHASQSLTVDASAPGSLPSYGNSSRGAAYLSIGAVAVGGGALLAVTGGLAAPAIAAGLGAAVSLAHGGAAAAAAAVAGFAGSTAGTAAVTGLFGAWGASVGGGAAGSLYGEVREFGFWDLAAASIYADGRPLPAAVAAAGDGGGGSSSEGSQEQQAAAAAVATADSSAQQQLQQRQLSQQPSLLQLQQLADKQPLRMGAAASSGGSLRNRLRRLRARQWIITVLVGCLAAVMSFLVNLAIEAIEKARFLLLLQFVKTGGEAVAAG